MTGGTWRKTHGLEEAKVLSPGQIIDVKTHETRRTLYSNKNVFCSRGGKQRKEKSLWLCQTYSETESFSLSNLFYSHRCTRIHPKATDFRQVWTAPFCYRVKVFTVLNAFSYLGGDTHLLSLTKATKQTPTVKTELNFEEDTASLVHCARATYIKPN